MGGGVLLDVGFYPVTMSRFCFDDEPTAVAATMEHDADAGVDVMTSAILRFPRGHAIFTCGMQLAPQQRAQLLGSKGHIDIGHAWNPASDQPVALVLETSDRLEVTAAERIEFRAREPVHDPGPAVRARGDDGRPRRRSRSRIRSRTWPCSTRSAGRPPAGAGKTV